jgi:hypothetical protein
MVWNVWESLDREAVKLTRGKITQPFRHSGNGGHQKLQIQRLGTTVISRKASIRFSSGGCVLNSAEAPPMPNMGFTMHKDDVVCEIDDVGIR